MIKEHSPSSIPMSLRYKRAADPAWYNDFYEANKRSRNDRRYEFEGSEDSSQSDAWNSNSYPRLMDLPQDVLVKIVSFIIGSPRPGYLYGKSLARAEDAFSLCCNHPTLYSIFSSFFDSLYLDSDSATMDGETL